MIIECKVEGCSKSINDYGYMCSKHWNQVPVATKEAITNPVKVMGQIAPLLEAIELINRKELAVTA